MHTFQEISKIFEEKFGKRHFPLEPKNLYDGAQYLLTLGGKRIRPLLCVMGNELVNDLNPDVWQVAAAIELFHNFTLVHDDIMDHAPLRRGVPTVHKKFGESTALLSGDVMLVAAYESLRSIDREYLPRVLKLFNTAAMQVCEGQQLDMDFESMPRVTMDQYVEMITLKTSVLLATSLQLGAVLGGAGIANQEHLYEFGKNLGIAFQVQDDYLDAFGDPEKFGKQVGGDILANKKTFLQIHVMESEAGARLEALNRAADLKGTEKVQAVLALYRECQVDQWAKALKDRYMATSMQHLDDIAVLSSRKKPLEELAHFLLDRQS
ncbi:MAG: polyprenyl synthetase family protein [Bacteroidota bacterium]|nr:polyprenyl synthetase family protein [Bacteroidota bacterium]